MAILAVKPYPLALAKLHKLLSVAANIRVEIFSDIDARINGWKCSRRVLCRTPGLCSR